MTSMDQRKRGKLNPNVPIPPCQTPEHVPTDFHFTDIDQVFMRSDWGEDAWLDYDAPADKEPTSEHTRRKRELFREFQRCIAADGIPATPIRLQVQFDLGLTEEAVWLEVESIRLANHSGWNIIGRIQTASRINPRFRSGDFVRLSSRDVIDWKIGDQE